MVAPEEDEASKTEEPSERKISKAKEEGDVAVSQEVKSFIMLIGMLFVINGKQTLPLKGAFVLFLANKWVGGKAIQRAGCQDCCFRYRRGWILGTQYHPGEQFPRRQSAPAWPYPPPAVSLQ